MINTGRLGNNVFFLGDLWLDDLWLDDLWLNDLRTLHFIRIVHRRSAEVAPFRAGNQFCATRGAGGSLFHQVESQLESISELHVFHRRHCVSGLRLYSRLIHRTAKLGRRFEDGNEAARDDHPFVRLRIASIAWRTFPGAKGPESTQFYHLAGFDSLNNGEHETVHDRLRLHFSKPGRPSYTINYLSFSHG